MAEAYQLEFEQDFDFRGTQRRETSIVPLKATTPEEAQTEAEAIVRQVGEEKIPNSRSGAIRARIKQVMGEIQLSQ